MTKNQKIIAALSIVYVLVIGAGVLTYTLRDNNSDPSEDNKTEEVIQETSNSSILSGVEELADKADKNQITDSSEQEIDKDILSDDANDNNSTDIKEVINPELSDNSKTSNLVEVFPNLKIKHDSSWLPDYTTENVLNTDLKIHKVSLSKNNNSIILTAQPALPAGCDENIPTLYNSSGIQINKQLEEFVLKSETSTYEYARTPGCIIDLIVQSNQPVADNFLDSDNNGFTDYYLTIQANFSNLSEGSLSEVRNIIDNSTFE